jgi:hypothetical protein
MKRLLGALAAALLCWLGLVASSTLAEQSPAAHAMYGYTYDTSRYDQPTDYAAPKRGPPIQLVASIAPAGHDAVDRWSDGTAARPNAGASVVTDDYDETAQLVQAALVGDGGDEKNRATSRDLSAILPGLVAAETGEGAAVDVGHAGIHQFPGVTAGKSQFFDSEHLGGLSNTDGVAGVLHGTEIRDRDAWFAGRRRRPHHGLAHQRLHGDPQAGRFRPHHVPGTSPMS